MSRFRNHVNRTNKAHANEMSTPIAIFLIIMGAIFAVSGVFVGIQGDNDDDGRVYTTAIVTHIDKETHYDHDGYETTYITYVEYVVDGTVYNERLGSSSISHKKGKEIEVYYYPDNPRFVYVKGRHLLFAVLFPTVGVLIIVFGVVGFVRNIKKGKERPNNQEDISPSDNSQNTGYDSTGDYPFVD